MFRDLPILDALQHVASKEEWDAYKGIRDVEPRRCLLTAIRGSEKTFH